MNQSDADRRIALVGEGKWVKDDFLIREKYVGETSKRFEGPNGIAAYARVGGRWISKLGFKTRKLARRWVELQLMNELDLGMFGEEDITFKQVEGRG